MLPRSLVVVAALLSGASAHASGERVRLAEVHAADAKLEPVLRSATLDELGRLDLRRVPASKEAILSIALVRIDAETNGASRTVTCVVSATLRGRKSGNLVAIIEGRARVESRGAVAETSAIAAAVHGAVGRVPEALR